MNPWEQAARELEQETGARHIHLEPGTDPNTTVEQIKDAFRKALIEIGKGNYDGRAPISGANAKKL